MMSIKTYRELIRLDNFEDRYRYLKLQGLDENKYYRNSHDGKTYKGEYYQKIGLNFSKWLHEFSTYVIVLEVLEEGEE